MGNNEHSVISCSPPWQLRRLVLEISIHFCFGLKRKSHVVYNASGADCLGAGDVASRGGGEVASEGRGQGGGAHAAVALGVGPAGERKVCPACVLVPDSISAMSHAVNREHVGMSVCVQATASNHSAVKNKLRLCWHR